MARKGERPSLRYADSKRYRAEVKALSVNLRKLRETKEWTLEEAEQGTGVDWKHLQKVEQAQLNVTLITLCRLAEGFDVPLSALFRAPRSTRK